MFLSITKVCECVLAMVIFVGVNKIVIFTAIDYAKCNIFLHFKQTDLNERCTFSQSLSALRLISTSVNAEMHCNIKLMN